MKHIVRMVVMAVAFVCFFSASPLLAQRVTEPDEKPAPTDQSLFCEFACWLAGSGASLVGCSCNADANDLCIHKTVERYGSANKGEVARNYCLGCCDGISEYGANACIALCNHDFPD
jgi:hypothetical protein